MTHPLISAHELREKLNQPNIVVLDASIQFQIPGQLTPITGVQIPSARRFDYEEVFCDTGASLPHMMPNQDEFNQNARELGLNQDSHIVVYDNAGTFASPRAWYMLKAMGHHNVQVLNGGLPAWVEAGFETEAIKPYQGAKGNFSGHLQPDYFVSAETVLNHVKHQSATVVDARSQARFGGQVPEPREGLRSGHIPSAKCLPFNQLLNRGQFHNSDQLENNFDKLCLNRDKDLIFSCGSGVTACILLLAADMLGYTSTMVYDGSWTEWGARLDLPIEC